MDWNINVTIEELRSGLGVKMKKEKDDGKKMVGSFCSYFPKELVWAAGAIPIGLCGNTDKPIAAAENVLPRDLCPTVKSTYGRAISGTCPLFYLADCLVGESTCDGRQKMYELLGREKPMHVMDLPKMQDEKEATQYWTSEVKKLKAFLEKQLNTEITEENIRKTIKNLNEERRLLKAIHSIRKECPPPITGLELLGVLAVYQHRQTEHKKHLEDLKMILEALQEKVRNKHYAVPPDTPRIMWTGLGSSWGSEKVLRLVEECGGVVVCQEGCGGVTKLDDFVNEEKNPIIALGERYLKVSCACMTPNNARLKQVEYLLKEYKIDGVVDFTRQFCALFDIESYKVREIIKDKYNIPYIHITSDFSSSDIEQLRTRIEGFIEQVVLAKHKKIKK